jgi:hypothetical protein
MRVDKVIETNIDTTDPTPPPVLSVRQLREPKDATDQAGRLMQRIISCLSWTVRSPLNAV